MSSDNNDAHRKHRRSTSDDEEIEKSAKRHKHRHHRHKHHHRHRRSSKTEDKGKKDEIGEATLTTHAVPVAHSCPADDDVEEGEILEDEILGEIKDVETDFQNPKNGAGDDSSPKMVINAEILTKLGQGKNNGGLKTKGDIVDRLHVEVHLQRDSVDVGAYANGDFDHRHHRKDSREHSETASHNQMEEEKKYCNDVKVEANERISKVSIEQLSSEGTTDKHNVSKVSILGKHDHVEVHAAISFPHDLPTLRYHPRGTRDDDSLTEEKHSIGQGIASNEFDDGHANRQSRERYIGREERIDNHETHDRERSHEKGMDRNFKAENGRNKIRGRGTDEDRRRERIKDGEIDSYEKRDREREREKKTVRHDEDGSDRRREKELDSSRDMEIDREHRRERRERSRDRGIDYHWRREEQERSRDRGIDRDWRREERERSRDREIGKDRNREMERDVNRDRIKTGDRDIERTRERDWDRDNLRDWDRNRDRDRNKERSWEIEKERERRNDRNRDKGRSNETNRNAGVSNIDSTGAGKPNSDDDEQEDFEERVTFKLAEQEDEDLNRIKEESRKRRQAILEKYKNQPLQQHKESRSEDMQKGGSDYEDAEHPDKLKNPPDVVRDITTASTDVSDAKVAGQMPVQKSPQVCDINVDDIACGDGGLGKGTPKSEKSTDMFCDDIFGDSPAGGRRSGKADGLPITGSALNDNWDDAEGYYGYRFGELLDGRYEVTAAHGKGVFSTVVRAKDLKAGSGDPEEVAIKIIRNNETMHKAGQLEVQILKKLVGADPENKRHCVRFLSSFKYRNHLCLVFESLNMNLREVLKKFGRNIGLKLTAVRVYAKQLFIALKHLKNCGVLHCDIKPDNMLVNEAKNVLKLCDFGNAMFAGKNEITPYLVSRFYRAPEIILGLTYDHPMDVWSIGCCLYEIYSGKVLFPGATNNDMLRLHMELKGPIPKKMLRRGAFADKHFDPDMNFHATEEDPVTKKAIKRMIVNIKPKDIGSVVTSSLGEDPKMIANFKDFLEKIFVLDPEKRITVSQALNHPFITGK